MKRVAGLALVGLFSMTALPACGDDDDTSATAVQKANAEFCTDRSASAAAVTSLAALDPRDGDESRSLKAADAVKSSRAALVSSGNDLSQAEWTNLQSQLGTLVDQLKDAPDDATVSSILTDAKPQATKVQASVATLNTAVCGTGSATTTTG